VVALVTGAAGIYGLTSYGVTQGRTVLTLVLRAIAAFVIGTVVGLEAWRRLGSVIASFLTNLKVTPSDPMPLVVTAGVLLAATLVACLLPARRARKAGRL
jgi:hypothetical protein